MRCIRGAAAGVDPARTKEIVMNITAIAKRTATLVLLLALGACGGSGESPKPLEKVGAADRSWLVFDYTPAGQVFDPLHDLGEQVGGVVDKPYDFGPATMLDPSAPVPPLLPREFRATGRIFSSAGGGTYSVSTEAPTPISRALETPIGNLVVLNQDQTYIKHAENATLRLKVTQARIEAFDDADVDLALCRATDATSALCDGPMEALISFHVTAQLGADARVVGDVFFRGEGEAVLHGWRKHWDLATRPAVQIVGFPLQTLWRDDQFTIDNDVDKDGGGRHAKLVLKEPLTIEIDLSRVLKETKFTLRVQANALVQNKRHAEFAYLGAFFRDPTQIGGDVEIITDGLELTDPPLNVPPVVDPNVPAGCVPGASAGALQFVSPGYTIGEAVGAAGANLLVARTGGSDGDVTATVSTSGGTATAGADYLPVNTTVTFKAGEIAPRAVRVPLIYSADAEPDKTFNLTLSAPTGCANLGLAATLVTILDDTRTLPIAFNLGGTVTGLAGSGLALTGGAADLPITGNGTIDNANVTNIAVNCMTPAPNGGLDTSFGIGGKVSTAFGGSNTAMGLQADGKVVMVGGSASDFLLARYNPDGSLDPSFGTGGLVTSDVGGGSADEARGVAIQSDGKIVVVGNAAVGLTANNLVNFDFAVARYNTDGSLDATFGNGGKVTTDFNGQFDRAFAVAIQSDGRIVVAGNVGFPIVSGIATDFGIARYNANGALDATFGSGGKVTTDIAGGVDIAQNVIVQANGAILVSGVVSIGSSSGLDHGALARYDANGILDPGFGTAGKLTLANLSLGEGLAVQGDGRIVVAGSARVGATRQFALMRLSAAGAPDGTFGTAGLVTMGLSTQDDFSRAVALQPDGKIVVAGLSSNSVNSDFAVARFDPSGAPDASFGSGGKLTLDFFGSSDGAENVLVQPDGKILLGGFARNGTRTGYGLARLAQ